MSSYSKKPYYLAIIAFIVFISGTFIAYLSYPNYSVSEEYTSDLVRGPHPYIFKVSTVSTGILLLPFYPAIFQEKDIVQDSYIPIIGKIIGISSILGLIMVGLLDVDTHSNQHRIAAGIFFIGTAISLFLWILYIRTIQMGFNLNFKVKFDLIQLLFLMIMICMIFYFIVLSSGNGPVIQKIIIFSLFSYTTYYAYKMVE